jgi:hypothetical protein
VSVFWLPIGLLLASIVPPAIFIAKRRGRITDEIYRLTWVVWSIAVILLSIGIGWSSYQMHHPIGDLENLKVRADALQKHIKAVEAQKQLMHFADPLQEADRIALEKYREVLRNTALSISDESKVLAQELASVRSQFDELNQARMHREFILVFCVLVLASTLILGAVYRDAIRRRRIEKRAASLRA